MANEIIFINLGDQTVIDIKEELVRQGYSRGNQVIGLLDSSNTEGLSRFATLLKGNYVRDRLAYPEDSSIGTLGPVVNGSDKVLLLINYARVCPDFKSRVHGTVIAYNSTRGSDNESIIDWTTFFDVAERVGLNLITGRYVEPVLDR